MPDQLSPPIAVLFLIVGITLTFMGAELLIRGAARIARRLGLSPFVIGVTVVAFGTSAPEMFASVKASLDGRGELGIGNVLGSNIANMCLILPVAAIIAPIAVKKIVVKRDAPIMLAITAVACAVMLDGSVSRIDGAILFSGIIAYIIFNYKTGKADPQVIEAALELEHEHGLELEKNLKPKLLPNTLFVIVGLTALSAGAAILVKGGVDLARAANIPEIVIGATIVAFGTSVPELAASIQAARKKESDIAIGNILGSNVFNLLAVLGAAGLARPIEVTPPTIFFHIPAVLLISILIIPIMAVGKYIGRKKAALLLLAYIAYTALSFILRIN
jgi:cation:H+ antiporter